MFELDLDQMNRRAHSIISSSTKFSIASATLNLNSVIAKFDLVGEVELEGTEKAYLLFVDKVKSSRKELYRAFSKRSTLKSLVCGLGFNNNEHHFGKIINSPHLTTALELISSQWQKRFFMPIFLCLLRNWYEIKKNNHDILVSFLQLMYSQISQQKRFVRYSLIMQSLDKIEGPRNLGSMLFKNNILPTDFIRDCGLPASMMTTEYFGEALFGYMKRSQGIDEMRIPILFEELNSHANSDKNIQTVSAKKCIAFLICTFYEAFPSVRERLRTETFRYIGDPNVDGSWVIWDHGTPEEKTLLLEARKILRNSINELFMEVFFESIAFDGRRQKFWNTRYKEIGFIKLYATSELRIHLIQSRPHLKSFVETRVGTLARASGRVACICMETKDYIFCEFSKTGNAFYAYEKTENNPPDIRSSVLALYDLKRPMTQVISTKSWRTRSFGRLSHNGNWEDTLDRWLHKWAGI